jgi:foldase protein PrsA
MFLSMRSLSWLALGFCAFAGTLAMGCSDERAGDGEGLSQGAVATVGDAVISDAAVKRQVDAEFSTVGGTAKSWGPPRYQGCIAAQRQTRAGKTTSALRRVCAIEFTNARARATSMLIQAEWLDREVRRRGLETQAKLRAVLARQHESFPPAFLRRLRRTEGNLDLRVRMDLQQKMLLASMPVTETEIREYGQANSEIFLDSERRMVNVIQAEARRQVVAARAELERGEPWRRVMDRYGIKPFADHWTMRGGWLRKTAAPHDAFGRSVFSARKGQLIGPINTLNGWFVFTVLKVNQPKTKGLSERNRATVEFTLQDKKLRTILHKRYASRTTCVEDLRIPEAPECL